MLRWVIDRKHRFASVVRVGLLTLLAIVAWVPVLGLILSNVPAAGRVVVAGLAIVSVVWPRIALLLLAGFVALGGVVGALTAMPCSLTEPLVTAFLAGWLSREAVQPTARLSPATRRLLVPVFLLATVVAASIAVGMIALQPFVAYPQQFLREILSYFWSDYFLDHHRYEPLTAGLDFLDGLGLFAAAAVLTEGVARLAPALARVTVAGAAGVAALSLNRLVTAALRSGDAWKALVHHLATIRISTAFPDVNAAGSYFAMAAVIAIGLGCAATRIRWVWMGAAFLLSAALWLTGSRVALFAVPITGAALLVMVVRARDGLRGRLLVIVALVALALIGLGAAIPFAVKDPVRLSMKQSMQDRWDLARAASAMAARHPVFGVGAGSFMARSGEFFTPGLRRLFPRENAHNNFLQILAELGVVGFVPFLWILGGVAKRLWPGVTGNPVDWPLLGATGGVVAFVITWVSGHPLLIVEVSSVFWIALGTCAGLARAAHHVQTTPARAPGRWLPLVSAAFIVFVILTLPVRAREAIASADLASAAIGCSEWGHDETGTRCRWIVAPTAQFLVPATASAVRMPFRLVATNHSAAAEVSIYLDGRLANRVHLDAGTWNTVAMVLPEHASGRYFRVEVDVGARHAAAPPSADDGDRIVEGIQMGGMVLTPKPVR
jgi:O-antigen ligase